METTTVYEDPEVYTLGTLAELTEDNQPDKCGGTSDAALPLQLSPVFSNDCP